MGEKEPLRITLIRLTRQSVLTCLTSGFNQVGKEEGRGERGEGRGERGEGRGERGEGRGERGEG